MVWSTPRFARPPSPTAYENLRLCAGQKVFCATVQECGLVQLFLIRAHVSLDSLSDLKPLSSLSVRSVFANVFSTDPILYNARDRTARNEIIDLSVLVKVSPEVIAIFFARARGNDRLLIVVYMHTPSLMLIVVRMKVGECASSCLAETCDSCQQLTRVFS